MSATVNKAVVSGLFRRIAPTWVAALVLLGSRTSARAQQTGTVGSLYLSNEAELNFGLYGADGGSGTNGMNSDQLAVTNQFDFSGASAGSYIVGFSHGDASALTPGSVFTLVTFNSTNFTAADATRFSAAPRGDVSTISGTFVLSPGTGNGGTLQFVLTSEQDLPEPPVLLLLASGALGMIGLFGIYYWRSDGFVRRA